MQQKDRRVIKVEHKLITHKKGKINKWKTIFSDVMRYNIMPTRICELAAMFGLLGEKHLSMLQMKGNHIHHAPTGLSLRKKPPVSMG
jgi:hypothetical protein